VPLNPAQPQHEPIFNLPAVVTATVAVLVGIHVVRSAALSPETDFRLLLDYAVVPARFALALDPAAAEAVLRAASGDLSSRADVARQALARFIIAEDQAKPWTALTYALLHGSWGHVLLNGVWLAAFGTPVARRCGGTRFLLLGALSAVAGAAAHVLVHPFSIAPMIGASAAVSGWMAASARFVFPRERGHGISFGGISEAHERPRQSLLELVGNRGAVMFLAVWFVTNLLFGLAAAPLGISDASIAWEAHIGGFLVGLLLFPVLDRR
jgi:membrane associated rhomboid family serine protease